MTWLYHLVVILAVMIQPFGHRGLTNSIFPQQIDDVTKEKEQRETKKQNEL